MARKTKAQLQKEIVDLGEDLQVQNQEVVYLTGRNITVKNALVAERRQLQKEIVALKRQVKLLERAVVSATVVANDPPNPPLLTVGGVAYVHDRLSQLLTPR